MKKLFITTILTIYFFGVFGQNDTNYRLTRDTLKLNEVTISAYSPYTANALIPITYKNLNKKDLSLVNYGQEPSRILSTTPSISTYSESGGDFGYSYIRMRGIDQTRINFTLNGVPLNEPEDFGCYFSNYPDFFQSVEMLQIQRGTGMSKNGSASYVGSINFESYKPTLGKYTALFGAGSGGVKKVSFTGEKYWEKGSFYVSLSDIRADGYKEHSGNHSSSAYFVGNYNAGKNHFKFVSFVGEQANQLAWLGSPMDSIIMNRKYNANTKREIDHFNQYHLQFHHTYDISKLSKLNYCVYYNYLTGFYTYDGEHLEFYDPSYSDSLYGYKFSANFLGGYINYLIKINKLDLYVGLNGSKYDRKHNGTTNGVSTYENIGYKDELSGFVKGVYSPYNFTFYGDLQYRYTTFVYDGDVNLQHLYWSFFNFSFGVDYKIKNNIIYYNIGQTNREPTRNDMFGGEDNLGYNYLGNLIFYDLKPSRVLDQEFGYRYIRDRININMNLYYMMFHNELVLTGDYGLTGLPLHKNVDESFRTGFEFDFKYDWKFGLSFTQNTSYNYSEIHWDNKITTPVLTPQWMANQDLNYKYKWFNVGLGCRYQSFSYINPENSYSIPEFYTLNAMVGLNWKWGEWKLYLNNITNQKFLPSGMMDGQTPLYFVSDEFGFFTSIRFKLM